MRFMNVFSVFVVAAVFLLIPRQAAIASDGSDFIGWALEQGEGLDRTWGRITTGASPGAARENSTSATGRNSPASAVWVRSTAEKWGRPNAADWQTAGVPSSNWSSFSGQRNWIHSTAGFIHKGSPELFPLSTRTRAGPSRGMSKLRNPASARLGTHHDRRRFPNARVPGKSFFHSRSGKWRISVRTGTRVSKSSQRSRVSTRSSTRISRPR